MRKTLLVLFSVGAIAAVAEPTKIVPGYFYPSSVQAGEKTRIVTGGPGTHKTVKGAWISGEGVKVTKVTHVPGFPRAAGKTELPWVREWLYEILDGTVEHRELPPEALTADTDWQVNDWLYNLDAHTDPLDQQIIARYLYTPEDYPQATPALDHLVILDVEVDPKAKPGCRTIMLYNGNDVSAPHPLYVTTAPHVREPEFVIPPLKVRHDGLNVVLHYPSNIVANTLPVCFDGQVWPSEIDTFKLKLRKGKRVTCVVNARELVPYLGDAVPGFFNPIIHLKTMEDREIASADDFKYLPDPILSCVVPEDGVYKLEIHDNVFRGRSDFVYTINCYEDDPNGPSYTVQQRAFETYPIPLAHQPPKPGSGVDIRKGKIDFPGRVVRHDFKVKEPMAMSFELFARRLGSHLDGEIRLYGPLDGKTPLSAAPLLASWTDLDKFHCGSIPQAICDARGAWNFLEAGDYCVTVSDEPGDGGDDFFYTLALAPLEPTFEVYSERSSFNTRGGATFKVMVVRRNGFNGEITVNGNDEFTCYDTISAGQDSAEITVTPKKHDWKGVKFCDLTATATVDGKEIKVPVTPGDPVEQAFAYTHYLPAAHFSFLNPED